MSQRGRTCLVCPQPRSPPREPAQIEVLASPAAGRRVRMPAWRRFVQENTTAAVSAFHLLIRVRPDGFRL